MDFRIEASRNQLTDDFAYSVLKGTITFEEVRQQLVDSEDDAETQAEGEGLLAMVATKVSARAKAAVEAHTAAKNASFLEQIELQKASSI